MPKSHVASVTQSTKLWHREQRQKDENWIKICKAKLTTHFLQNVIVNHFSGHFIAILTFSPALHVLLFGLKKNSQSLNLSYFCPLHTMSFSKCPVLLILHRVFVFVFAFIFAQLSDH